MIKIVRNDDKSITLTIFQASLPVSLLLDSDPVLMAHRITESEITHSPISLALARRVREFSPEPKLSADQTAQLVQLLTGGGHAVAQPCQTRD